MKRFLACLSILLIATAAYAAETSTVKRVIDGNTIMLTDGTIIELIGIDVPAIVFPEGVDVTMMDPMTESVEQARRWKIGLKELHKMGLEAREFVKSMLNEGQVIRLERDVEKRDNFGRSLAYVLIPVAGSNILQILEGTPIWHGLDGPYRKVEPAKSFEQSFKGTYPVNLNTYIIQSGYATPRIVPPNVKYADLFKELHKDAMVNYRGLWRQVDDGMFSKTACEEYGGKWGRYGEIIVDQCNLPTDDAGVKCLNHRDCQGACIAELTKEQEQSVIDGKVLALYGACSQWTLNYGCHPFVENGKVEYIMCKD